MDITKKRVDIVKAKEGVWYPVDDETSFLLARAVGTSYKQVLREKMLPYVEEIRSGDFTDDMREAITVDILAERILLGWKGLKENGEDIPYSTEKAKEILSDPGLDVLRELIEDFATNDENFYTEGAENLKK